MKVSLSGLAALFAFTLVEAHAVPADACGVKLTVNGARPKRAAARSSRPTHILLVGNQSRMQRDLAAAGHDVEVVADARAAKRPSYTVIVVGSADEAKRARAKFSDAIIVQRTGDVGVDLQTIEDQIQRPVRADKVRTVIAAGPSRTPVAAARRSEPHKIVAAKVPAPEPAPTAVPPAPTPPAPTPPVEPKPAPVPAPPAEAAATNTKPPAETEPPPAARATGNLDKEVYFTVGSSTIVGNKKNLDAAVKWLASNADAHVTVEGYADPTGSPDANMALSQSRAESVRDFLVKAGTDASRIDVTAYGDTKLKYGRTDRRNRRVAIEGK